MMPRHVDARRRPGEDRIFRVPAALGEVLDIGERDTGDIEILNSSSTKPRTERREKLSEPVELARISDDLLDFGTLDQRCVRRLADERHGAL